MLYKLAAELAMIEEIDKEAAKRKGMKGNQKQAYKNKGKGGIKSETEGLGLGSQPEPQPEPQEKPVNALPNEEPAAEEAATKGEGFLKGLGKTIMEHKGAGLAGLGALGAAGGAYALYRHNKHI